METYIAKLNATVGQEYSAERTAIRSKMCFEIAQHLKSNPSFYDIHSLIDRTDFGTILFCLALIFEKTQNPNNCYFGPRLSPSLFKWLMRQLTASQNFVQNITRITIDKLIAEKIFTESQKRTLITTISTMENPKDSDHTGRKMWITQTLITLVNVSMDSLIGSLVGQCVGDSLGFLVEGHGPAVCSPFVEKFINEPTIPSVKRNEFFKFGQYSDDSQLARELLIGLRNDNGVVKAETYGKRLSKLFIPGNYRIVGYGKTCAQAGEAIYNGASYKTTGCTQGHGNGSAMRSVPIGLVFAHKTDEEIVDIASKLSAITHARGPCVDGAVVVALAGKYMAATKDIEFEPSLFTAYISQHVNYKPLKKALQQIPTFLQHDPSEICKYFVSIGTQDGESTWDGISAGVIQTVLWSIYSICKAPNSFKESIGVAIKVGGDVDTTAAIVGGLIGARLGHDAIPRIWREKIHDIDVWNYNELCQLVEDIYPTIENKTVTFMW